MQDRIRQELELLRVSFSSLEYAEAGRWVRLPAYVIPGNPVGWNRTETQAVFQIPVEYPGAPPYGIYVPMGIRFNGNLPGNYAEPAPNQPPFAGQWGIFSWTTLDGKWFPAASPTAGHNLSNWVRGFADRFREGA